ncbi:MAG: CRISPR-associated endonuclease Cas2 [Thiotrichales bacterium]
MAQRNFYLACYDIANAKRLKAALLEIRQYAVGGQKSAYELSLTAAERVLLLEALSALLDVDEDRFFLLSLDPRSTMIPLGIAQSPFEHDFFYID